jgi:hypothetical protein
MRSTRSLGLVITRPRDLPLAGRPTVLAWTKRRWACGNTAHARASFTELQQILIAVQRVPWVTVHAATPAQRVNRLR